MTSFSYKVCSHEVVSGEPVFILVRLRCLGYPTEGTHPNEWEYDLLVPRDELGGWPLGSLMRLGLQ